MTPSVRAAAARVFLSSFVVLFLEVALIRWLPAHIRLLSYFSNVVLLAAFLGIGVGALLARARATLFPWFPLLHLALTAAVFFFRFEVTVRSPGEIYFTSGTADPVVTVESTYLLPVLFVAVAVLFVALAQRMAREMATLRPLRAYTFNLAGSLAGVGMFALVSWAEQPPTVWFAIGFAAAVPLLAGHGRRAAGAGVAMLAAALVLVHVMAAGTLWSPYYRIALIGQGDETVIEVNNIFHQSMAPLERKEYFYRWPYEAFGGKFRNVLILGAGSGTDVAAALRYGARQVDAVEIDPAILRLGAERHPDRPYADPRVRRIVDDARHYLRTTNRTYDLVVFALIDSLTLQSAFSGVRLESYMFTEESFRAVRERLTPDGVLVIYNYFREPWLVDRLANMAARAFGAEPVVYIHTERDHLAVLIAGPGAGDLPETLVPPSEVAAYGQPDTPAPAARHERDRSVISATDDWPFLYLRRPHLARHYLWALALMLAVSTVSVLGVVRGAARRWSWEFFFLGAGFMLLETKSITQFALLWGSTWVVASLAIASVLVMALTANFVVSKVEIRRPWVVGAVLIALVALNYAVPVGRVGFESRAVESVFYAVLVFSPIFCAGLLFGSGIKRSPDLPADYGANLLGAMAGGVSEYLSLLTGFRFLLILVAMFYVAALLTRRRAVVEGAA